MIRPFKKWLDMLKEDYDTVNETAQSLDDILSTGIRNEEIKDHVCSLQLRQQNRVGGLIMLITLEITLLVIMSFYLCIFWFDFPSWLFVNTMLLVLNMFMIPAIVYQAKMCYSMHSVFKKFHITY